MKIAIVGAGPAGIYLSRFLRSCEGVSIHLFEHNDCIGAKLRLTGGGRMNVANRVFGVEQFTSSEQNLLNKLFRSPWIEKHLELFDDLGVDLVWEKNRAILASGDAVAEVERLALLLEGQSNLTLRLGTSVDDIAALRAEFDAVVLTGGAMLRLGDADTTPEHIYALPLALGHTIVPLSPCLSPLSLPCLDVHRDTQVKSTLSAFFDSDADTEGAGVIVPTPLKTLSGLSFEGPLRLAGDKCKNASCVTGGILITHMGLSGPAVLDFSSYLGCDMGDMAGLTYPEMSFFSEISEDEFTEQFDALRQGSHKVIDLLYKYAPRRLAHWIMATAGMPQNLIISDTPRVAFKKLRSVVYHYPLVGAETLDYKFCWTTRGGVSLREVNVAKLESRVADGVYFAGEVLDVAGLCGGYNISFAAISAKIVAEAIAGSVGSR